MPSLEFVVPGALEQRTGGYLYDAHVVRGLREAGWNVRVHNVEGRFPDGAEGGREALAATLASLPSGSRVVIDGLAMGGNPGPIRTHGEVLSIVSLLHHPLADETGLTPAEVDRYRESERLALEPCRGVVVTSEYTARRLTDVFGVAAGDIRAVPPGTEPARFAVGPGPGQPFALVCVASLTPRKGHEVLVSALARIQHLPWSCVFAGSPDLDPVHAERVRRCVADAGLTDRITFVGELGSAELDGLYHRASIFVLASYYEGYGMALAEALARGLPVVSTTGGAIPFTVPPDAGVLVDPGDDKALAGALERLLAAADEAAEHHESGDDETRDRRTEDGEAVGHEVGVASAPSRSALAEAARRHAARLPDWKGTAAAFGRAVLELVPE